MTTPADVIDRYFAIWNETDAAQRQDLIASTWDEQATYRDPMLAADGAGQIDAMVAGFHSQFSGLTFVQTGEVEHHHDRLRFTWDLLAPTGDRVAAGTDVAVLAADGRLLDVTGFFDHAPVLSDAVAEGTTA